MPWTLADGKLIWLLVMEVSMLTNETKLEIIEAYDAGDRLVDIARRYGVSPSRVSTLARAANRTKRKRGAKADAEPSPRVRMLVEMASRMSYRQVSAIDGKCTRQNVSELCKKWVARMWARKPLIKVGDIVTWYGEPLTVLAVYDHVRGDVLTRSGKIIKDFKWRLGNNRALLAKKPVALE